MNKNSGLEHINPQNVEAYPFSHLLVKDYFPKAYWDEVVGELSILETTAPDNRFESENGVKSEWKHFGANFGKVEELINELFSENFISQLKSAFSISPEVILIPDRTFDGGGYVVSPPGSFLGYHADFNFSSKTNSYRVLNVLVYANENYSESFGGKLHLLDQVSKTVEKSVSPNANTLLAFLTDDLAFHGVSRNYSDFYRRSFNLYYYASEPVSTNQSLSPHRTIWLDIDSHDH